METPDTPHPVSVAASCLEGGITALARALDVTPSTVSQWISGHRPVPHKRCWEIEEVTGGKVSRFDLRPDIFGPSPDQAA